MAISVESLKGYILEEIMAFLIKGTGYELLVDPSQDPRELDWQRNGLVVKGRGAVHQVDVLGQLSWVPAFTFPLRLFLEAKFREETTGIHIVRNAIGVILDINQNNSPTREQKPVFQKFQYVYAICSTSGFSTPAQDMALAHQISLLDLSNIEYYKLREAITKSAESIVQEFSKLTDSRTTRTGVVMGTRTALREELDTWPSGRRSDYFDSRPQSNMVKRLSPAIETAREYGELFVGMANGPYMLLLKADDPTRFVNYCKAHPRHDVGIHWSRKSSPWTISPSEEPSAYKLSFILPDRIRTWIFDSAAQDSRARALSFKRRVLSSLTIVRREAGQDYLFRLEFDPESISTLTDVDS